MTKATLPAKQKSPTTSFRPTQFGISFRIFGKAFTRKLRLLITRSPYLILGYSSGITTNGYSLSNQHGQRRNATLLIMTVFLLIYLPRIPRLDSYLLVSSKKSFNLVSLNPPLIKSLEQKLIDLEGSIKYPSFYAQKVSAKMVALVNDWLQKKYCPEDTIARYAQGRISKLIPVNTTLERRCYHPIDSAIRRERALAGWTQDGRIQLNASSIVFLAGDSLMQGPASRLSERLRREGMRPIDASRVSTGLAYPLFFNWVERIQKAISEEKVDAIIVFLGANDTFDMYDAGSLIPLGSEKWRQIYSERVQKIGELAKEARVPIIWLGMPAMGRKDIHPHVPMLNQIFESKITQQGGMYIPTASILGDSEEVYTSFRTNGRVRIPTRSDDGVHFTVLGWTLVADAVMQKLSFD